MEELPIEILMKIFSYLPSYDKVSLVNKKFYNIVCEMSDSKICLALNPDLFVSIVNNFSVFFAVF